MPEMPLTSRYLIGANYVLSCYCARDLNPADCDRSFINAVPTAELEPITENYVQADEVSYRRGLSRHRSRKRCTDSNVQADMGMTYDELSIFGRLRKVERCGPYGMFTKLVHEWGNTLSPAQVRTPRS